MNDSAAASSSPQHQARTHPGVIKPEKAQTSPLGWILHRRLVLPHCYGPLLALKERKVTANSPTVRE
jgi:hypothetical protein